MYSMSKNIYSYISFTFLNDAAYFDLHCSFAWSHKQLWVTQGWLTGCTLSSIQGKDKGKSEAGMGGSFFIIANTKQERGTTR